MITLTLPIAVWICTPIMFMSLGSIATSLYFNHHLQKLREETHKP